LTVEADERIVTEKTYVGESICVEGVCLTVTSVDSKERTFTVDVAGHTLDITAFGDERGVKEGSSVNLELALPASKGNSGHEVQGHVDCTANIVAKSFDRDHLWVTLRVHCSLDPLLIAEKGYVAVDGTSLTVCNVRRTGLEQSAKASCEFQVMLVPHTQNCVTLPLKEIGASVNIEAHCIGKYIVPAVSGFLEVAEQRVRRAEAIGLAAACVSLLAMGGLLMLARRS